MRKKLAKHLGRVRDNDYTCMDVPVYEWILKELQPRTLLDIGCANGGVVQYFQQNNVNAIGVDGDPWAINQYSNEIIREHLILNDYTISSIDTDIDFDVVISYDMIDHLKEEYLYIVMTDFLKGKKVILSTPRPDCPGWHHVNCRTSEYWIEKFENSGFVYNQKITEYLRSITDIKDPHYVHDEYSNPKFNLLYFERKSR